MNKLTALARGGMAWLCLLLALPSIQLTAQTDLCPPYPRAMDQAFFCLEVNDGSIRLKLDQNASLHNPVRFRFLPKSLNFTDKTQHRRSWPQPLTAEAAAAYLASLFNTQTFSTT